MRYLLAYLRGFFRARFRRGEGLSEVEYEAITMIALEGRGAHARAREEAARCRAKGSESGFAFWSKVAGEIALRTSGKPADEPRVRSGRLRH